MRSPRRWAQELYLLGHQQGAEFRGEAFDEILIRKHSGPMCATVGVVIEFPEMYKLIDRTRMLWKYPTSFLSCPPFWRAGKPISW